MARRLAASLLALLPLLLGGCASAPPAEDARPTRPLVSYSPDPFVPVNLYLNANEQLPPREARLVEHAVRVLRECGAFVRLDRGVQRWPITLQARYELQRDTAAGDRARRALGALTLGLVPVRVTQIHRLYAELFTEPESIAALELEVTVRDRVSLYDAFDREAGERAAVESLLERFMAEVAQRKLIPRWKAFAEEPKKKPKSKKTPGRPT